MDINLTTSGVLDRERHADMKALSLGLLFTQLPIRIPNKTVNAIIRKLPTVAIRKT
jgi:hypothetical protein